MKNSFSKVCSRMGFGILSSERGGSPANVSGRLQNGGGGGDAEDPWESLCSQPPADFGDHFSRAGTDEGWLWPKVGAVLVYRVIRLSVRWALRKHGWAERPSGTSF